MSHVVNSDSLALSLSCFAIVVLGIYLLSCKNQSHFSTLLLVAKLNEAIDEV